MTKENSNKIDEGNTPKNWNKLNVDTTLIRRGVLIFIFISVISFAALFFYTNTGKIVEVWSEVNWYYLALGCVFIFNDLYLGGLRNHIFIREFVPGISIIASVKANLANIFLGAATPTQTGGGAAQIYIFHKYGVSLADNISNSLFNWISTLIFFPLSGALAIYILEDTIPDGLVLQLTHFGFRVFATLFIVVLIGLLAPNFLGSFISFIGRSLKYVFRNTGHKISLWGMKAATTLKDYQNRYRIFFRQKPHLFLYSFLLTIILYFNKYALAYILLLAFEVQADFWTVISIQAVLYLLLYFSPSPGGSGIAEISIGVLMASILHEEYLASFALLYRSFLVFVPAMMGAYVLLHQLKQEATA
ncbi:MAG: flippase-like domain-containing protein [Saprospiraceae bacterium]|nr:flippase-like domain-containing protein [Saprospiraceae bacterium]